MSDKKEIKEIDVASLDSELAAARTLEEGKGDKFIMMASVVAFLMTSFHIYTGFFAFYDIASDHTCDVTFSRRISCKSHISTKFICSFK